MSQETLQNPTNSAEILCGFREAANLSVTVLFLWNISCLSAEHLLPVLGSSLSLSMEREINVKVSFIRICTCTLEVRDYPQPIRYNIIYILVRLILNIKQTEV